MTVHIVHITHGLYEEYVHVKYTIYTSNIINKYTSVFVYIHGEYWYQSPEINAHIHKLIWGVYVISILIWSSFRHISAVYLQFVITYMYVYMCIYEVYFVTTQYIWYNRLECTCIFVSIWSISDIGIHLHMKYIWYRNAWSIFDVVMHYIWSIFDIGMNYIWSISDILIWYIWSIFDTRMHRVYLM